MDGALKLPFRKLIFWAHLIIGIVAGIGILIKAVTGVILAYETQLVEWAERDVRNVKPSVVRMNPSAIVSAAQAARPEKKVSGFTIKSDPKSSVSVNFGRDGMLYINPYNGNVLGTQSKVDGFMHQVDDLHRWYLNRPIGRPISGAVTICFSLLALSGLYIWWPTTWTTSKVKSITVFNGGLSGKARDWNWHNVIGFWSAFPLLLISLTGVVMSYTWANNFLYRLAGSEPPPAQQQGGMRKGESAGPVETADVDALFLAAASKAEAWDSINVRFPQRAGASYTAFIQPAGMKMFQRSQITFDKDGSIKKWEPWSEESAGRQARVWARYLHTGEAGGWWGQGFALLFSAGTAVLVWTGFSLAWRRWRG